MAVIGAGIVGAACALALTLAGRRVTLVDPEPPGRGASFGNAGGLSAGSVLPLSQPGILREVPRWLADPLGPLSLRWRYLPFIAPWLVRFVRAGSARNIPAQVRALRQLNGRTLDDYRPLLRAAGAEGLVHHQGHLTVYRSRDALERDRAGWLLRRAHGVEWHEIGESELRQMEPALARDYRHAMFIPENGHCTDPAALVDAFVAKVRGDGGAVLRARALGFELADGRASALVTNAGPLVADDFVLAAGAWSARLTRTIGDALPLETERGYHATLANPGVELARPLLDGEAKFAVTSMRCGLRLAGTVELAGLEAAPDWRRARRLLELGRRLLPGLPEREQDVSYWMGHRPSLPDSLPVIGRAGRVGNIFYAFGHGHTGLTGAAPTAMAIRDLICGREPELDLAPYRPGRFRQGMQT
ncbi:MAG: FAD-binding oxidoreductase [Alphaproteobacteria bacterium]|nr:FAD-binding oxidoreductase [Alphaproteobacteria bacterium]